MEKWNEFNDFEFLVCVSTLCFYVFFFSFWFVVYIKSYGVQSESIAFLFVIRLNYSKTRRTVCLWMMNEFSYSYVVFVNVTIRSFFLRIQTFICSGCSKYFFKFINCLTYGTNYCREQSINPSYIREDIFREFRENKDPTLGR